MHSNQSSIRAALLLLLFLLLSPPIVTSASEVEANSVASANSTSANSTSASPTTQTKQPPNVVLIISDDAGWADFGFQGSTVIPTPQLDRLAQRSVRCTYAYAGSVCSPSRAALVTGVYHSRIGYDFNIIGDASIIGTAPTVGLEADQVTMFDRLKELGYSTSVVGKWHLGRHQDNVQNNFLIREGNQPNRMGVDEFWGLLEGSRSYWCGKATDGELRHQVLDSNGIIKDTLIERQFDGQYVTDVLGELSCRAIQKRANKDRPFFLYASFTAPHTAMQATDDDLAAIDATGKGLTGNRRVYAAMMLAMDRQVGRILNTIRDPNQDGDDSDSVEDNTLIIFINDNGGDCCDHDPNYSSNGPLRGGKGSSWEGGFRVPLLIAGPSLLSSKANTTFAHPVHLIDLLPTMLAAAGSEVFDGLDGVDLMPHLNGIESSPPHEHVYLRYGFQQQVSLRMGKWKLYHHAKTGFMLFDLEANPSEKADENLIAEQPELVARMKQAITAYDIEMDRPKWGAPNQINRFRFREGRAPASNWSRPQGWHDELGELDFVSLTEWDGYPNTELVFRSLNRGQFVSVNDLHRQSGLEFMANSLTVRSREQLTTGDSVGIIRGNPLLLVSNLSGQLPTISLVSVSTHRVEFDFQFPIQLNADLAIGGDGNGIYKFTGGFHELQPKLRITKTGQSTVSLGGENKLTGTIELMAGTLHLLTPKALGTASVVVQQGATLRSDVPIDLAPGQTITGEGTIEID